MVKTCVAALCALFFGCTSVHEAPRSAADTAHLVPLRAGDRITIKATQASTHVCVDDSRLVCGNGNGRLSYVSCECQRATAAPALLR